MGFVHNECVTENIPVPSYLCHTYLVSGSSFYVLCAHIHTHTHTHTDMPQLGICFS